MTKLKKLLTVAFAMALAVGAASAESNSTADQSVAVRQSGVQAAAPAATTPQRTSPQLRGAFDNINPCNVDYGGLLSEWNRTLFSNTLQTVVWWWGLLMTISTFCLIAYLTHVLLERERVEQCSIDIVCELLNWGYHHQDAARAAIATHNEWVARMDDAYDKECRNEAMHLAAGTEKPLTTASKSLVDAAAAVAVEPTAQSMVPVPGETDTLQSVAPTDAPHHEMPVKVDLKLNVPVIAADQIRINSGKQNAAHADQPATESIGVVEPETSQLVVALREVSRLNEQLKARDQHISSLRQNVNTLRQRLHGEGEQK